MFVKEKVKLSLSFNKKKYKCKFKNQNFWSSEVPNWKKPKQHFGIIHHKKVALIYMDICLFVANTILA